MLTAFRQQARACSWKGNKQINITAPLLFYAIFIISTPRHLAPNYAFPSLVATRLGKDRFLLWVHVWSEWKCKEHVHNSPPGPAGSFARKCSRPLSSYGCMTRTSHSQIITRYRPPYRMHHWLTLSMVQMTLSSSYMMDQRHFCCICHPPFAAGLASNPPYLVSFATATKCLYNSILQRF